MIDLSLCQTPYEIAVAVWVSIREPIRYSEIRKELGMSEPTCLAVIKSLIELQIIEKRRNGLYYQNTSKKVPQNFWGKNLAVKFLRLEINGRFLTVENLPLPASDAVNFGVSGKETAIRETASDADSAPASPFSACHVRKQDSPLMKAKNERKRKFASKIESVPKSEQTFKSTWNILAHVPDKLMPKFAETVNFVWKYLKCRRSEKFSPDLLWRIAYPFVSDEFGEVTNDWLDRMLKECETAKNAEGKEKCNIRCAVINERVKILYAYHNWIYAACRKEYDCCEEERYLAKAENRAFRLELFPMEAERLAAEAKKAAAKQAETPQEKPTATIGYDKKTGKFYAKPLSTESLQEPATHTHPAELLPDAAPAAEPGRKYAPRPHFSPLLTQKSLDAVKRNASKTNPSNGVSTVGEAVRELAVTTVVTTQPEPAPPQPHPDYWNGKRLPDLTDDELQEVRCRCSDESQIENEIKRYRVMKMNRTKYQTV